MNTVVVGVDQSSFAADALRWAIQYAAPHDKAVTAIMAWSHPGNNGADRARAELASYGEARLELDRIVEHCLGGQDFEVTRCVVRGMPAAELIAASRDASLVVVGARGLGGFDGLLLGSVSRNVLNGSHSAVAVVRPPELHDDGPIVIGVDGSPASRAALRWALDDACVRPRRVVGIYAWERHAADGGRHAAGYLDEATLSRRAETLLNRELEQAVSAIVDESLTARLEQGGAAGILVAASASASLLVVGSRDHNPLAEPLLGSVSDQVAHHACSPVVFVPPALCHDDRHPLHRHRTNHVLP